MQQGLDLFEKGLYSEASAKFKTAIAVNSGDVQE